MGCDGFPCLKGLKMKDLKRHCSCPLARFITHVHYSVYVYMNDRTVFTKGQECFLNVFFFLWVFSWLLLKECACRCCANAMYAVVLQSFLSQNTPPPSHMHTCTLNTHTHTHSSEQ